MQPEPGMFHRIANYSALAEATHRAAKGKRRKANVAAFLANQETRLLGLETQLMSRTWEPGSFRQFTTGGRKQRRVSAALFRDRIVHHALCHVVEPVFERGFITDSYANRKGKGTHRAIARYEQFARRHEYVLRCDIFRYFPAIDHEILKLDLRRRITCKDTLWLLDMIIDRSNPQELVIRYFSGDDLFTPIQRRRGLPIGNLTSQFFGNVYLNAMDHFIKEWLRAKGYLRYVDDFALFSNSRCQLEEWRCELERFLAQRRLLLHPRKTVICGCTEPATFLGVELLAGGRRRLPATNVEEFRRTLQSLRDRWRAGNVDWDEVRSRIGGWQGHAIHADTWRLRHHLFRGGSFDPARKTV